MSDAVDSVAFFAKGVLELSWSLKGMPYRVNAPCLLDNPNGDGAIRRFNYKWTDYEYDRSGYGVYVMFDFEQDTVLYVGKTNNIEQRLSWWFWHDPNRTIQSWDPTPAYVMTITLSGARVTSALEQRLIDFFNPKFNERLRGSEAELLRKRGTDLEGVEWWDGTMRLWGPTDEGG